MSEAHTYRRSPLARIGKVRIRILVAIVFISMLAPFIANDIPLYSRNGNRHNFPVLSGILPGLFPNSGAIHWQDKNNWGEFHILPLIPYHSRTIDLDNAPFVDPFDPQNIPGNRYRHWLGTDDLGRDVLAGLLHGASISLIIGILASLLAVMVGILVGGLAGYFGDDQFKPRRGSLLAWLVTGLLAVSFSAAWFDAGVLNAFTLTGLIIGWILFARILSAAISGTRLGKSRILVPLDLITLRIIETIRSVPDLFLIIGIAAIIRDPGIYTLIILIAFLRWPVIARYVRAEMLNVRSQDYVMYARGTGLPPSKIFWGHALPNALTPVWILGAFSVAIAILLESSLSFLGIGIPPEWVTWGSMLNLSRRSLEAWHLALFPGLAMFAVIYFFNDLGERLEKARKISRQPIE